MNKFFFLIIFTCLCSNSYAQSIGGIINSYASVVSINQNIFTVNTTAGFSIGDKVMIIKMKGATVNITSTPAYGDTILTNEAGEYVFSNIIDLGINTMTLSPYCNFFPDTLFLQIVKIPIYPNPTVVAPLTCMPFDGFTGGILAFEVLDTLTLNAPINANNLGYQGGNIWGNSFTCGAPTFFSPEGPFCPEGKKGEGICEYILGQQCGRGKLANGGGGAYAGNSGAGGGANAGNGGNGGWEYSGCISSNSFSYGGQALNHADYKFFLGGGGGGPQSDNGNQIYNGGNGGGIIYIKAKQIIGNAFSISANGESTPTIQDEGASGGGAGGSIYLNIENYLGPLNITATGGAGGSNNNATFIADCHGPGGGGGGGLIDFSSPSTPIGVTTSVLGGNAGLVLNPASQCFNTSYNAQNGGLGLIKYNFIPTPMPIPPAFSLGADLALCQGTSLVLNAGPGYTSYLWDDLSNAQTRTVTTPGTYFVTIINNAGCTASDTVNVIWDTTVNADFSIIIKLGCENDTITCVNNSTGASQYVWFFGDSQFSTAVNPTHVYQGQAVYNVTLIASNPPCADTMVIPIDLNHPINADIYVYGSLPAPQLVKEDTTCVLYKLNAQSLSFPVGAHLHEFNWGDGTISNTLNNPYANHLYSKGGTYFVTLTITDTIGCKDSVTKKVFVDDVAFVDFTISDSVVCIGTPIVFKDTLSPFTISWDYDFGDGSGVDNMHNPIHTYDNENNFIVTLTAKNLICPDSSKSKSIVVDDYPRVNLGKDTSICPGLTGTIILTNLENTSGVYEWSTGEITNAINVVNAGRYWVKAQSANAGCESVDSIWVTRDCYINIPNAFSPDGDGRNDYFFPRELLSSNLKSFRMNIYNRWGENIFTTDKIDGRGWDGKYNGKPQPMGSYVYIIDCEFNNFIKKNFKGNVTLVR